MNLQSGDIITARNTDKIGNSCPGYWNHIAIYHDNTIIEAQSAPKSVIQVYSKNFFDRYPEYLILRFHQRRLSKEAGKFAVKLVGKRYSKFAWFGENCVSVVKKAYKQGAGVKLKWRIPDDAVRARRGKNPLFKFEYIHKDHANWVKPTNRFGGRIARC